MPIRLNEGSTRLKMSSHRFAIGQSVRLRTKFGVSHTAADTYKVTALLPERNNSPQYRIRSDAERHERVAMEDDLEESPRDLI